jgi:hypothetical protein
MNREQLGVAQQRRDHYSWSDAATLQNDDGSEHCQAPIGKLSKRVTGRMTGHMDNALTIIHTIAWCLANPADNREQILP